MMEAMKVSAETGAAEKMGYRPGLDGLRALAVLVVIGSHGDLPLLDQRGRYGVAVFFALSGYLITRLMLEELRRDEDVNIGAFYKRRARRLLPALVVMLAVVCTLRAGSGQPYVVDAFRVLLYQANWYGGEMRDLDHTWSLAVEEHFYLLWPLVFLTCRRHLVPVTAGLAVLSFAVSLALWSDPAGMYHRTDSRAHLLLLGCLAAMVPTPKRLAPIGVGLMVAGSVPVVGSMANLGMSLVAVGTVLVIPAVVDAAGWLASAPLVWIGRRSYGLYLWNLPALYWIDGRWQQIGFTFAAAALSWVLIEQRFLSHRVLVKEHLAERRGPRVVGHHVRPVDAQAMRVPAVCIDPAVAHPG